MVSYPEKYSQLFDYLSSDDPSDQENGLVVFGRKDLLVAHKAIDIVRTNGAPWMVVTGGIGKDSADLVIPEAEYLAKEMFREGDKNGLALPQTYLDTMATNGNENAHNSLTIIQSNELDTTSGITTVAHATSSRRLAEMMKHTAIKQGVHLDVYRRSSDYQFDPSNPTDQEEARAELLRLADWPEKGWLQEQPDLPQNLVDFVRDQGDKTPKPVPAWKSAVLHQFPQRYQQKILRLASKLNLQ